MHWKLNEDGEEGLAGGGGGRNLKMRCCGERSIGHEEDLRYNGFLVHPHPHLTAKFRIRCTVTRKFQSRRIRVFTES